MLGVMGAVGHMGTLWGCGATGGARCDAPLPPPPSQVDENPDMDNLDIESRDAEERYFDEEEPSAAPQLE